jgi:hypothetical protein
MIKWLRGILRYLFWRRYYRIRSVYPDARMVIGAENLPEM